MKKTDVVDFGSLVVLNDVRSLIIQSRLISTTLLEKQTKNKEWRFHQPPVDGFSFLYRSIPLGYKNI